MTAIVGMLCSDGVVVGADSSATFGPHRDFKTVEQPVQKIEIIGGKIILAGTGEIGLGQRFHRQVELAWKNTVFKDDAVEACRQVSQMARQDFHTTGVPGGRYAATLAFPAGKKFGLCEFGVESLQPEQKKPPPGLWWVSMGGGQPTTDPFLAFLRDILWPETQPNVSEGVFATVWALEHVIACKPGGVGGPVTIAVLTRDGTDLKARLIPNIELQEHYAAIEQAKAGLKTAMANLGAPKEPPAEIPSVPKPSG